MFDNNFSKADPMNFEKIQNATKNELLKHESILFDGDPSNREALDNIIQAIAFGMQIVHRKNKKYTPKKYSL